MDNNDYNFEQFIRLLDGALATDDKNVKKALRKFLFVAALVMGNDTEPGPFTEMMETIDRLQERISTLEKNETHIGSTTVYPSWINNGTSWTTGGTSAVTRTPTITSGSGSISGSTGYINPITTSITSTASTATGTYTFFDSDNILGGTAIKEKIKECIDSLAK